MRIQSIAVVMLLPTVTVAAADATGSPEWISRFLEERLHCTPAMVGDPAA